MRWDDESAILADPDILSETHIPPDIPGRQSQINELTLALRPATQRRKPMHCWVYGSPGTGKTATSRWLLRKLDLEAGVKGLYLNCWEYPTYFSVLDRIVRELRVLGAERLTVSFKLEHLQRHIGKQPLVIVLDEIDQPPPKDRHAILYNLSQMENIGLVCLCNSQYVYFGLEERVTSRLNALRILFLDYSADDLTTILKQRAEQALMPDAWSEDILQRIAELAHRDARIAIQTLRNAALLAEKDHSDRIRATHVQAGWNSAKDMKKTYLLRKLTDHHRLLHDLIAKNPGILSGDLWRLYLETCRSKAIRPIAVRTYSEYCNKLVELGLIQAKRAAIRGRSQSSRQCRHVDLTGTTLQFSVLSPTIYSSFDVI